MAKVLTGVDLRRGEKIMVDNKDDRYVTIKEACEITGKTRKVINGLINRNIITKVSKNKRGYKTVLLSSVLSCVAAMGKADAESTSRCNIKIFDPDQGKDQDNSSSRKAEFRIQHLLSKVEYQQKTISLLEKELKEMRDG